MTYSNNNCGFSPGAPFSFHRPETCRLGLKLPVGVNVCEWFCFSMYQLCTLVCKDFRFFKSSSVCGPGAGEIDYF